MARECKCSIQQKMLGDGCETCNPALALDFAKERITELETRIAELEKALKDKDAALLLAAGEIEELDGYLGDWLRLDDSIGARLKSSHNWSEADRHKHGAEIDERSVLREQVRVALGL